MSTSSTTNKSGATLQSLFVTTFHLLGKTSLLTLQSSKSLLNLPIMDMLLTDVQGAIQEYLTHITPERISDWAMIGTCGIRHFSEIVLGQSAAISNSNTCNTTDYDAADFVPKFKDNTHKSSTQSKHGPNFRRSFLQTLQSAFHTLCSPTSRQSIIDNATLWIKCMEALHTPEVHAMIQHGSVAMTRTVDVMSSREVKEMIGDLCDFVWSAIELGASDEVCHAVAEVCAHLVHVLEMEYEVYRTSTTSISTTPRGNSCSRPEDKNYAAIRAERRRKRGELYRRTYGTEYVDGVAGECSVEEAILASLGGSGGALQQNVDESIVVGNHRTSSTRVDGGDDDGNNVDDSSLLVQRQIHHQQQNENEDNDEMDGHEQQHQQQRHGSVHALDVDVDLLKEGISQRAQNLRSRRRQHVKNVQRDDTVAVSAAADRSSSCYSDDDDEKQNGDDEMDIEDTVGRRPSSSFLKQLDDVMTKKRKAAIDNLLLLDDEEQQADDNDGNDGEDHNHAHIPEPQRRRFFAMAAAAAGSGNEYGQETLKAKMTGNKMLSDAGSRVGVGSNSSSKRTFTAVRRQKKQDRASYNDRQQYYMLLFCGFGLAMFVLVCLGWILLGAYGFYALFIRDFYSMSPFSSSSSSDGDTMVIREVVYLLPNGTMVKTDDAASVFAGGWENNAEL